MCVYCKNARDIPLCFFSDSIFLSSFLEPEKERMKDVTSDFTQMFYEVIKLSLIPRPSLAPVLAVLQRARPGNEATSQGQGKLKNYGETMVSAF